MSRPRLLLHAGFHKTGTTAIQEFAAGNREALQSLGICYPAFKPSGVAKNQSHNRLAHSLARTGKSGALDDVEVRRLLKWWRILCGEYRLFVSAEALSRHVDPVGGADWKRQRIAYLQRSGRFLADFEVEPILVLRRQADFVHSVYFENIMKASRRGFWPFARFRDYLAERHLRFEDNIDAFVEVFGNVRVLIYEDLACSDAFCARFFEDLGVDVHGLVEPGRVRASLSPGQARIKRTLLPVIFTPAQSRWINAALRNPRIKRLAERILDDGGTGMWEGVSSRNDWQRRYEQENERIRARFLPERAALFPADGETGT